MRRILILILLLLPALAFSQVKIDSIQKLTEVDTTTRFPTIHGPEGAKRWKYFTGKELRTFSAADIINRAYIPSTSSHSIEDDYGNFIRSTVDDNNIYYCDYDGNCRLVTTGAGGLTSIDTAEVFATTLTFDENKQIGPYTVSGNVTFTVDETGAMPGAFSTIRMNFGPDSLYTINFSGSEFDSVQFFNIASGDTLVGYHIVGFEYTKWGVAVYVPTNQTTSSQTVVDEGGGGTLSVVDSIGNLVLEFDSRENVDTTAGNFVWTDKKNGVIAQNAGLGTPTWDGTNAIFTADALKMDSTFTLSGAYTIGFAGDQDNTGDNTIFGDTSTANFGYILLRPSTIITNIANGITTYTNNTGNLTFMVVCDGDDCTFYKDNVEFETGSQTPATVFTWLGEWFSHANGDKWDGNWNHFFFSKKTYSTAERNRWFNWVNSEFSLGL
jgi:hypothetical protein